jgi:hypothetical protein
MIYPQTISDIENIASGDGKKRNGLFHFPVNLRGAKKQKKVKARFSFCVGDNRRIPPLLSTSYGGRSLKADLSAVARHTLIW